MTYDEDRGPSIRVCRFLSRHIAKMLKELAIAEHAQRLVGLKYLSTASPALSWTSSYQ